MRVIIPAGKSAWMSECSSLSCSTSSMAGKLLMLG